MNQYFLCCTNKNDKINMTTTKISHDNIDISFDSIYYLYKKEFPFHCEKLLLKSRNDILDKFFKKMKSIIYYYYKYEEMKNLENVIKKCENNFITNEYIPMYNALSLTLSIISSNLSSKNKIKYSLLNENLNDIYNFIPHCLHHKSNNEYALHSCGEKLIEINSKILKSYNNSNKNTKNIKYALCPKCKKCYQHNFISIYCKYCDKSYFSKIIKDCQLYPCTWEKYHCINEENENSNDINNYKYEEQMPCVKCGSKFFIKKNKLFCNNCKFEIKPIDLVWTCFKCYKEFRSQVKIFNNLNNKIIKHIIIDALISQKIARPGDLPCDCLNRYKVDNINFYHKKEGECNGVLYYNSFNKKDFIVCSLCQYICYLNDFNWFCPFCLRYFISNKIKIFTRKNDNSNIYIRKNILENRPKSRRYFSPKSSFNINIKNENDNCEKKDKTYSDRNHLRVCSSQQNIGERYIYPNKISEKNKNDSIEKRIGDSKYNSQISTLITSYQNNTNIQSFNYNKKMKSCNISLDDKNKSKFGISNVKKSDKKLQKTNLKIYISNKKLKSKLFTSNLNKYNNSITKFIPGQKINDNSNNLDNMSKDNIKLTKPKINISTSLLIQASYNENNIKENKNSLNDQNYNAKENTMNEKIIYSNKSKKYKCVSLKKSKNNINNCCLNKYLNKEKTNMKNKAQYNFSQKKLGEETFNLKKYKLKKIEPDCLFSNGIISQRNKIVKNIKKEKSCEI